MTVDRRSFIAGGALVIAGAATLPAHAHDEHHVVKIEDFKFDPEELTVPIGAHVTFTNADVAPHTATADDGSFDTERLNRGEEMEITLTEPGEFTYFCRFHPGMKGRITVA